MIYRKPILFGFFVFFILLLLSIYITTEKYELNKKAEIQVLTTEVVATKERLTRALDNSQAVTSALNYIIENNDEPENFDLMAKQLLKGRQFIDAVQLVKGGVITHVYPLKGNERIIGYNIFSDSLVSIEAKKSITKKQLYFSGAFELRQGGLGVVGRLPIFKENKFWGFAAVVIRLPTLLKAAGIDNKNDNKFIFQLSKINPNTLHEEFFFPNQVKFNKKNSVKINVPDGEWNLFAQPQKPFKLLDLWPLIAFFLVLSLIGGYIAWYFAKQPQALAQLVFERTKELKTSEEKYRSIANSLEEAQHIAQMGSWELNLETNKLTWSKEIFHIFEKDQHSFNVTYETFLNLIHPEDRGLVNTAYTESVKNKTSYCIEHRLLFDDGRIKFVLEQCQTIYSKQGVPLKSIGTVQNISDLKIKSDKLKKSLQRNAAFLQALPDLFFVINKDGIFTDYKNPSNASTITPPEVFLQKSIFDILPAKLASDTMSNIKHVLEKGEAVTQHYQLSLPEGAKEFEARYAIINENEVMAIVRDMTEEKKAEEKLIESNQIIKSLLNNSNSVICLFNSQGEFIMSNKKFEEVCGISSNAFIGKTRAEIFPKEIADQHRLNDLQVINTKQSMFFEETNIEEDGRHFYLTAKFPLFTAEGEVYAVGGISTDVTHEREVKLKLEKQNEALHKANSELDRLVYSASHDLRAPLKSMLGLVELLKIEIDPEHPQKHMLLEMMKRSVIKLDDFIEDILDYSRNTRMEYLLEKLNFEEIIKDIKENHKFLNTEANVNFEVDIKLESLFINDLRRVKIILNNLISNALKYHDTNNSKSVVLVKIRADETKALIEVSDNGIGIDHKDQEKIFEMFHRATKLSTGSGLGLYIVQETLKKMDGTIKVESELGKGSKFMITIPNKI